MLSRRAVWLRAAPLDVPTNLRSHQPIRITAFKGRFDRGEDSTTPVDHFLDELNLKSVFGGFRTREGSVTVTTFAGGFTPRRMHLYKRVGEADRLLVLDDNGNIYDSLAGYSSPILTVVGMTDFACTVLSNRAYISPHDRNKGLAGKNLYVYQGSGTARLAGGSAPTGFTLGVTNSAVAGKIEAGKHLFAVAFETDTGFITQAGPTTFTLFEATGGKKASLTSIPTGPAGTVARHILATKTIAIWSGNQAEYELFFAHRIDDNTTTALADTVSFYDADLVSSADYLLDQLSTIPAFVNTSAYNGRLVGVGENANPSVMRVSKSGDPESFSETDGFIAVDPGDAGEGLKNTVDLLRNLYIFKGQRAYVVSDNDDEASTWGKPAEVDSANGTECFGVSVVLDSQGNTLNRYLIAARNGLYDFEGAFVKAPLTWKIKEIWNRINPAAFNTIQVWMDPILERIYVNVPLDSATEPTHVLMGDFSEGLDAENIKWWTWQFPKKPTSIVVNVNFTTKRSVFHFLASNGHLYKLDDTATDDFSTAIENYFETAKVSQDDLFVNHFTAIRFNGIGSGSLQFTAKGLHNGITVSPPSMALTTVPARLMERLFFLRSEVCSVKCRLSSIGDYMLINGITIFAKISKMSRPQVG